MNITDEKLMSHRIKFYILIVLQISAILHSLLIILFFFTHRIQLKNLQHQGTLLLLIVSFFQLTICLPMPINFYYRDQVVPATVSYCTWWNYIEFSFNLANELLVATLSVQRHILIFQSHFLNNRFKRYILHFIPFSICIVYPFVVYLFIVVMYTCDGTQWDYTANACGYSSCYIIYSDVLTTFDLLGHNALPILIIILANITLILRVISEKYRRHRPIHWKQHARMSLQLLAISSVYLISWLPTIIIIVTSKLTSADLFGNFGPDYGFDMVYGVPLFVPWVYFGLLSECRKWLRNLCSKERTRQTTVRPIQ